MSHQSWINDLPEQKRILLLDRHPQAIRHLTNPSHAEFLKVFTKSPDSLCESMVLTVESQQYIVNNDPSFFWIVENPDPVSIETLASVYPAAITFSNVVMTDAQAITALSIAPHLSNYMEKSVWDKYSPHVKSYAMLIK